MDEIIVLVDRHLGLSEEEIRARIGQKTARIWPSLDLQAEASQRLIAAAAEALMALRSDARHETRKHLAQLLFDMIEKLRVSPTFPAEIDNLRRSLLESPVWADCVQTVSNRIGSRLQEDIRQSDSGLRAAAQSAVCGLGENLVSSTVVRLVLNMQIRQFLVTFVERRRHHAAELIAETMRHWDAVTMSSRIEDAIGRDLQYIRINGTVIGGLIGVVIHAVSSLVLR